MDLALRWGFWLEEGAFEIWQQSGWLQVAQWIKDDIAAGKTISQTPLPAWVFKLNDGVYVDGKHYDHSVDKLVELDLLPVYNRQLFPELLLNEQVKIEQHTLL